MSEGIDIESNQRYRFMVEDYKSIFVVIVNWNLFRDTIECVSSILGTGLASENIVLVDNGSTDGSSEMFLSHYGDAVNIIDLKDNLGLAHGMNAGIQFALSKGAKWILLLNNDTIVSPELFTAFIQCSVDTPEYSILGPLIYYYDDKSKIWFFGDKLIPGTLLTRKTPIEGNNANGMKQSIEVDFISGCAMFIKSEVFMKIGGFDTSLFMYAEEVDFCWRAKLAGYRLAGVPRARLWHKVSLSSGHDKPKFRCLRIRNQIWYYRRYAKLHQKVWLFLFTLFRVLWLIFQDLLHGYFTLVPASARGWRLGWFTRSNDIPQIRYPMFTPLNAPGDIA